MNETNPRQLIILGVLLVAIIGVVLYQFGGSLFSGSGSQQTAQTRESQIPDTRFVEVDLNVDDLIERTQSINFDYAQERIERDPMRPLVGQLAAAASAGDAPSTTLRGGGRMQVLQKSITAIVWDEYSPYAVVDNEVVGIGHVYPDGIRVHNIEQKRVTFAVDDTFIRVDMKEPGQ